MIKGLSKTIEKCKERDKQTGREKDYDGFWVIIALHHLTGLCEEKSFKIGLGKRRVDKRAKCTDSIKIWALICTGWQDLAFLYASRFLREAIVSIVILHIISKYP